MFVVQTIHIYYSIESC